MPRLKASQGEIIFKTPFPEEFQRWLCYELENSKQWNPELVTGGLCKDGWYYSCVTKKSYWNIRYNKFTNQLMICSKQSVVWIRKGLSFSMGQGRLIVEAMTP